MSYSDSDKVNIEKRKTKELGRIADSLEKLVKILSKENAPKCATDYKSLVDEYRTNDVITTEAIFNHLYGGSRPATEHKIDT